MYLKIRRVNHYIEIIDSFESITSQHLKLKDPKHQFLKVNDLDKAYGEIEQHNEAVAEGIKQKAKYQQQVSKAKNIKEWNFALLTESHILKLKTWFKQKAWSKIMDLHNSLKLTDEFYCCTSYQKKIIHNMQILNNELGF